MQNDTRCNRLFGSSVVAVMLLSQAGSLWRGEGASPWLMELVAILAVVTVLRPGWLLPVRQAGMTLMHALRRLFSPVLLALLFFVVFTPVGWVMRLGGRDLMRRRFEPLALTYWIRRNPRIIAAESFRDQF